MIMPVSQLEETNANIILALSKMGVYMERDRNALDKLSPQERNARLQNAFDRTVENCCIFPMLFSKQEQGMHKLVLSSGRLQWTGWRESKLRDLRLAIHQCDGNFFKAWVTTLGGLVCVVIELEINGAYRQTFHLGPYANGTIFCNGLLTQNITWDVISFESIL
jgi:hypothetical protein